MGNNLQFMGKKGNRMVFFSPEAQKAILRAGVNGNYRGYVVSKMVIHPKYLSSIKFKDVDLQTKGDRVELRSSS